MQLIINGSARVFTELSSGAKVSALMEVLGFRADRVALERNGAILPRAEWPQTVLEEGDKLEIVHFVGGGCLERG